MAEGLTGSLLGNLDRMLHTSSFLVSITTRQTSFQTQSKPLWGKSARNVTNLDISSAWRASPPWISQKEPCLSVPRGGLQRPQQVLVMALARADDEVLGWESANPNLTCVLLTETEVGGVHTTRGAGRRADAGVRLFQTTFTHTGYLALQFHVHLWYWHWTRVAGVGGGGNQGSPLCGRHKPHMTAVNQTWTQTDTCSTDHKQLFVKRQRKKCSCTCYIHQVCITCLTS